MTSVDRLVFIDLSSSSDEEDTKEMIIKGEDKKMAASIRRAQGFTAVEVLTKEAKTREDDECCILTFDPYDSSGISCIDYHRKIKGGPEDDLAILAEKGKVALKDYPHSRFQCGEYPFDKTPHESCCAQCYCYACDVAAPCFFWTALYSGHCDASDKEEKWTRLRLSNVLKRSLHHN